MQLAGRLRRLVATAIDAVLVPGLTILFVMLTDVAENAEDYTDDGWMVHVFLLAVLSYLVLNGVTLWRRGQTLGKWVVGIAIAPMGVEHFAPAPWWKLVCIRALFFPLLFLLLPPWLLLPLADQAAIFGRARRCLHDYAAGTMVVRLP